MKDVHKYGQVLITGYNEKGLGGAIGRRLHGCFQTTLTQKQLDVRWEPEKIRKALKTVMDPVDSEDDLPTTTLINCAAIMDLQWFEDYSIKRVREIIETNMIGAYNLSQQFVKLTMKYPCRKYIVHIGSMAARVPLNGSAPYCMSKAGLEMMTRCMAWELAPKNYNVLCINPSNIDGSPMEAETIKRIQKLRKIGQEAATDYWRSGMIRDRLLSMEEISKVVQLFISGNCSYLSGNAINLTGGLR